MASECASEKIVDQWCQLVFLILRVGVLVLGNVLRLP